MSARKVASEAALRQQQEASIHAAARCIQLAWTSFRNKRIYRLYKNLIRERYVASFL